jgi:hypothetical protein
VAERHDVIIIGAARSAAREMLAGFKRGRID